MCVLVDRRRSLGEDHTRMVSQLHQLLLIEPKSGSDSQSKPGLRKITRKVSLDSATFTWTGLSCPVIGCIATAAMARCCKVGLDAWSGSRPASDCNFDDAGAHVG